MRIRSAGEKRGFPRRPALLAAGTAAALVLSLAGWWSLQPQSHLQVLRCETGASVLQLDAPPGTLFSIWFLHSYDRSDVEEHYRVLDTDRILMSHMTFKSTLNGQGFEAGTYRARSDGSAELTGIDREFDQVVFRLGSPDLANHTLHIHGRSLRLLDFAQAGDLLCIRVHRGSPVARILPAKIQEAMSTPSPCRLKSGRRTYERHEHTG
jgi:hypothetical protein